MMGLSSPVTTTGINEALTLINAMMDPQQAKRVLDELARQTDELNQARDASAALKAQADADRAAADKLKAELDAHAQDLVSREQAHNAAVDALAVAHDNLSSDMAALDASRRSATDDHTRREVAVAAREAAVTEREQKNAAETETLKAMRQDLEERLTKLRSFVA
jgi:chromosome segregation ATPase